MIEEAKWHRAVISTHGPIDRVPEWVWLQVAVTGSNFQNSNPLLVKDYAQLYVHIYQINPNPTLINPTQPEL